MFLSNLSIKRPVFATVMMLALVTLGFSSYRRLPVDLYPNVEIPVISVVTIYQGASPEAVEREVSKPIEEAVHPIAGVKHISSISREGVSQIFVEFELEVSADRAVQDARTKISAKRGDLPLAIEDPIIDKIDIGGIPIVSLAVRSTVLSPRDLTTLVDKKIKRRLENVHGVGKIDLVGSSTREIRVDIRPERLDALGLNVDDVVLGLRGENVDLPLGRITTAQTEIPLRVQGKAKNVGDFRSMIVAHKAGRPVTLSDVADVEDGVEETRSLAIVDGEPAIALDVLKQSGANVVGLAEAIKTEVVTLQKEMPPGTHIDLIRDGSLFIREAVDDVQQTMLIGGALTVLIVFVFLNSWRSTVITGLTLPISVISSFIVMNFAGMTLNVMTLMALSLAIGLLIDDAIVVRENIVRHLQKGEDHFTAARNGTSEIGLAVLATSFSIIAVFIPVAFMKGIVGRFFFAFGITVAFAVLVSLFVSFTLDPMLSSRWVDPDITGKGKRFFLSRGLDGFNRWFNRTADRYRTVIGWALDHRLIVTVFAAVAFAGGLAIMSTLKSEFFPEQDQGEFMVNFKTAPHASVDETKGRMDGILAELKSFPEVERLYGSIGAGDAGTVREGRVYVKLVDRKARTRRQQTIQREVRQRLGRIPGVTTSIALAEAMDNRKPLIAGLRGEDLSVLRTQSAQLQDALYKVPGIVDLERSLEYDAPEYRLVVDRARAVDAGLSTARIAGALATLVGGQAVTTFEDEEGENRDVRVRLPGTLRQYAGQFDTLRIPVYGIPGAAPSLVPLGSVARYELSTTPSEINRTDLSREVTVSANLDALPLGSAVAEVKKAGQALNLPPGYRMVITGENEAMDESFAYMGEALLLAVVFVYLILAAQFESFIEPFAIMLSLPLSIVGMAGMLLLTHDTINIMSLIGLIMLMGLVTKNAILLVDYTKVLRERGLTRRDAVIEAGRTRLRPIIMTTTAMVFGMLPLALALGAGGELRAPMARAVIGGLITSTLLTLVVVPVVYTLLDDLESWVRGRRREAVHAAAATTVVVALLVIAPPAAHAGQPPQAAPAAPGTRILTLQDALAVAVQQNRDVKKAEEYRNWVNGKYVEERAAALPHVVFGGNVLRTFDNSQSKLYANLPFFGESNDSASLGEVFGGQQDIRSAAVTITQPIYTWGQVGAALRAASIGYEIAGEELRTARQAVVRDVAAAFYDVLAAKELVRIAEQDLEQKQRHLDQAKKRQLAGTATDYDVLAADITVQNAQPAVIRSKNAVRVARLRLAYLLAITDQEIDVSGALPAALGAVPSYESVLAEALKNRPDLDELGHQRLVYNELKTIERAAARPRFDFAAGYGARNLGMPFGSATGRTWNATVIATIPVFDGFRTKGRIAQVQSDADRLALDEAKLRDGIALQVRAAVDAVEEAGQIVKALDGTVSQAERLLFLSEKGFELGVNTRLDVQDAELNLTAARGNLARAQRDYRVALVNVDWVAGVLETGTIKP